MYKVSPLSLTSAKLLSELVLHYAAWRPLAGSQINCLLKNGLAVNRLPFLPS
jgi:hypothetical protein